MCLNPVPVMHPASSSARLSCMQPMRLLQLFTQPAPLRAKLGCTGKRSIMSSQFMAAQLMDEVAVLPKVLDLDYTIWPFWCECYTVHDTPELYPHAQAIMEACRQRGIKVAAASRTPTPHMARAFMDKLGLTVLFDNIQLIPAADGFDHQSAQKDVCHLPNIQEALQCDYNNMLFFDDELKNVQRVARLGVCSVHVSTQTGLDLETFGQGLQQFAAHR